MPFDLSFTYIIVQVIFLEGILSIDNAAVLGAMVSALPKETRVPWPSPLKFLGPPVHRFFGGQRSAALKVGLLGAYLGRGLMLILANYVIHNPYLKILGALYLIKLAFNHLGESASIDETQDRIMRVEGKDFWSVVVAVELADLAFSLDNVVAVVALSNNLYVVMFGVAIGIITMRFAAGIFTWMIQKEPILKPAAFMVVFNIGVELLLDEFLGIKVSSTVKFMVSAGTLILFVAYARIKWLHVFRPLFHGVAKGMAYLNTFFDWMIIPVIFIIRVFFKGVYLILRPIIKLFQP
jgi:YkoY family integral membrane protein